MTTREQRVDQVLAELRLSESTLSAKQLASILHVSTRSIREYVRELNSRYDDPIVHSDQHGYRLNARIYRRARNHEAETRSRPDDRSSRSYAILDALLRAPEGVDVYDLADELGYSEATIEADLVRIRPMVREFGISLARDGSALRLAGTERDKRRFYRSLLTRVEASPSKRPAVELLERDVAEVLKPFDLAANDYVVRDLALHLTIAANRVSSGNVLPDPGFQPDMSTWTGQAVTALAHRLSSHHGVDLPGSELSALARVLGARFNASRPEDLDPKVEAFVRESIDAVAQQYLLELGDESTIQALSLHVQELIRRGELQQQIKTPLGTDFKRSHALIHEVSLFFAHRIEQFSGISLTPSEVDFLSFHLGSQFQRLLQDGPPVRVVLVLPHYAPNREGQERRLRRALEGTASLIGIVDSTHPWNGGDFDLAITVGGDASSLGGRVVEVSPFFSQADIDLILGAVREVRRQITRQHLKSALLELLRPTLYRRVESATQSEAIQLLAADLAEQGYVGGEFEIDVLEREARSSTNFGGRFAIPHSMYMDAHETAIAILTSAQDIPWPDAPVQLVAMFAVSPDSREVFRDAIDEMNRVFQDPRSLARLVAAGATYAEFIRHLTQILDT